MSEGTIGPWRDLLKQFQAAPVKKKRLRLLRQTAKKAKTFLAQKTVRLLRSARDRLGAACKAEPENAAAVAKSNAKQAKLAARLERTLAAVKVRVLIRVGRRPRGILLYGTGRGFGPIERCRHGQAGRAV